MMSWEHGVIPTVDVGLPIPVIECSIAWPFLGLKPLADLVLANPLWVPFWQVLHFHILVDVLFNGSCICSHSEKECGLFSSFIVQQS